VPDEYVDAVLPHVFKPVKAMIQVQQLTGMRPGDTGTPDRPIQRPPKLSRTPIEWRLSPLRGSS
jgi:hypothetical protein